MKFLLIAVAVLVLGTTTFKTQAQIPIVDVIKNAIKKAIKAIDLEVQRQQNKVLWLQTAQKTIENAMSTTKLTEITDWVAKQKALYKDYYEELTKVKDLVSYYKRIKEMTEMQVHLVAEYKRAWTLFRQDKHFTAEELSYISKVYSGIINESVQNIDLISMVVNSFHTQMTDAKRLELINAAANRTEINYNDLKSFNQQGMVLSLQRAKALNDVDVIRKLYGLQ
ncbi:MAG: conjugal transfer protein TraI [Bacteroidota bacterium]